MATAGKYLEMPFSHSFLVFTTKETKFLVGEDSSFMSTAAVTYKPLVTFFGQVLVL